LKLQALELAYRCLNYDFIGSAPDDTAEDLGSVHVPSSWKSTLDDGTTIRLFVNIYEVAPAPQSTQVPITIATEIL
jgi:exportin-7